MKFKVGDEVKVIDNNEKRVWLKHLVGKKYKIQKLYKCANPDKHCYDIGEEYVIPEDQLELVTHKFKVGDLGLWAIEYDDIEENIINFEDFDWSDFMSKKEFTKADLKNGDVVKLADGDIGIVIRDTDTIIYKEERDSMYYLSDDLVFDNGNKIVAVRRPIVNPDCSFTTFTYERGELVYERKEVEEMTLEEVCKALGKEIKIVKK